jgi:hypothetical protein
MAVGGWLRFRNHLENNLEITNLCISTRLPELKNEVMIHSNLIFSRPKFLDAKNKQSEPDFDYREEHRRQLYDFGICNYMTSSAAHWLKCATLGIVNYYSTGIVNHDCGIGSR